MPVHDNVLRTRDQIYATKALARVKEVEAKKSEPEAKSYGSMAHALPILIRTAGLAQALTFVDARSKKDGPQKQLLDDLAYTIDCGDRATLLKRAREDSLDDYMRLTRQAMAALLWFKRFAQSVLDVDAADKIEEEGVHG